MEILKQERLGIIMNKLWLKITGVVVLVVLAIVAVKVFWPDKTSVAESMDTRRIQSKTNKLLAESWDKPPGYDQLNFEQYSNRPETPRELLLGRLKLRHKRDKTTDEKTSLSYLKSLWAEKARQLRGGSVPSRQSPKRESITDEGMIPEHLKNWRVEKTGKLPFRGSKWPKKQREVPHKAK